MKLYRHSHWYHNDRCVFHRDVPGYFTTTHCTRLLGLFPVYRGGDREYLLSVDGAPPGDSLPLLWGCRSELSTGGLRVLLYKVRERQGWGAPAQTAPTDAASRTVSLIADIVGEAIRARGQG